MIIRFRRKNDDWNKNKSMQLSAKGSLRSANRSQASRRDSIRNQPLSVKSSKKPLEMSDKKVDDELFDASFDHDTNEDFEASDADLPESNSSKINDFFAKICDCEAFAGIQKSELSMMSTNVQNIE